MQLMGAMPPFNADEFTVSSVFTMTMIARPEPSDPIYRDYLILVICGGVGYATSASIPPEAVVADVIGQDARHAQSSHDALNFALLDAAFGVYQREPNLEYAFSGTTAERARRRGDVIVNELARLCPAGRRVLLVGAVRSIIVSLNDANFVVAACDMDETLQGRELAGVAVEPGGPEMTLEAMRNVDVVVATGMTLVNGTIAPISELARKSRQPLVMYCQSGAALASHVMNSLGVSVVISEPFPNYLFPGKSIIRVFRGPCL